MGRVRRTSWILGLLAACLAVASSASAQRVTETPTRAEFAVAAGLLAQTAEDVETKAFARADQRIANRARAELAGAAADLRQLAALVQEGGDRAARSVLIQRLEARRRSLVELGMSAKAGAPSKEEVENLKAMWEVLQAYHRHER